MILIYQPNFHKTNISLKTMKTFLFLLIASVAVSASSVCSNDSCCIASEHSNNVTGNGFRQYNPVCNESNLNCIGNTSCELCFRPSSTSVNLGNRPLCNRYTNVCSDNWCCISKQHANPTSGDGYLQYNSSCCVSNLNCVNDTCCQLCHNPAGNNGNPDSRPICSRF
jgi:hypothetical protein